MRLALLPLLVVLAFPAGAQPAPPEAVLDNVRARVAAGESEGVFLGIVEPGGRWTWGDGRLSAERPVAPDAATLFEIGSITKAFTGLLLAEMATRDEVALDDPIAGYLPDSLDVAFADRVTLEHLATHTSGLPRLPGNFAPADMSDPYADYTVEDLYAFLDGHTLEREPGAAYAYSNLGMGLLGHLLARHAGLSFEALLRERVLDPLGLDDTVVTLRPDQQARMTTGHSAGQPVPLWAFPTLAGAGALRSTGADMLRFAAAHLGLVETPLAEAMALARTPRAQAGHDSMAVGLGWHVRTGPNAEVVWHNGGTGGFRTFVGIDEAQRRGVVVLTNANLGMDDVGMHLLDPGLPLQAVAPTADLAPETLARYVGRYQIAPGFVLTIAREEAQLTAQLTGQPPVRIYPASETEFFLKVVDARLTFRVDGEGTVEGLTLHQNGQDTAAQKIE